MLFNRSKPKQPSEETHSAHTCETITFMVRRDVKELLEQGKACFDEGKLEPAIELYRKALEADPSCALCHFNLGYAYHENLQHNLAQDSYEKAVELEPTCSLFLEHLARLHMELLDYPEASRLFHRASMVGQIQAVSLGLWGRALFEQGKFEESIDAFERLLEQNQNREIQVGALFWLAVSHTKLNRIASARTIAHQILAHEEVDTKILYDLAENFIESRCLSLARTILERLAVHKEEYLIARLRLDDIRTFENQIDEMLPKLFEGDEERTLHQIHSLREYGNEKISKALMSLINTPSAPIRESIVRYQTAFGYDVAEQIVPLLSDPVIYVREAAYEYIEKLNKGDYIYEVLPGLNDPLLGIRLKTFQYLGRFGTVDLLPKLEMALTDPINKEIQKDLRKSIHLIKKRYQKTLDHLSKGSLTPSILQADDVDNVRDWKFWLFFILQIILVGYFVYSILFNY